MRALLNYSHYAVLINKIQQIFRGPEKTKDIYHLIGFHVKSDEERTSMELI